ncbi:MAG: YkvA family protein [Treponema sp.]
MTHDEKKKSEEMFDEFSQNASKEDITKIASKLDGMKKGPVAEIWDWVTALWNMIKDPNAAWSAKALAIGALVYLVSPVDAIPDVIPVLGLTDDVGVITAAVAALADSLTKYKNDEA